MKQQIVTVALLLLLMLSVAAPFSALTALMLIVFGLLLYWLILTLVRALVTADVSDE